MKYNVIKNGEVVKKNLSKKQAEDYCEKMNQEFMDSQEEIQKRKQKSGLPLRKNKYELYKVEVVKENVIKLTESDLMRIVKRVINEQKNEMSEEEHKETLRKQLHTLVGNEMRLGKRADMSGGAHHMEEHEKAEKKLKKFLKDNPSMEKYLDEVEEHFYKQLYK
jgi:hypothetical protein